MGGVLIGRGSLRNPWIFGQLIQGTPPDISLESLIIALQCYVQLERILGLSFSGWPRQQQQQAKLSELCQLIWSLGPAGTRGEIWSHALYEITAWSAELSPFGSDKMEKVLLGRLKMLWNYLRSSVPRALQDPALLRIMTVADFWEGLRTRMAATTPSSSEEPFRLTYQPEWDWVYGGGGRKAAEL
jgi:tRNA-dihydrouridine synthase